MPIKMLVLWAAGGPTDSSGREPMQKMCESIGQAWVIEYKPCAIGHASAACAVPDGYIVLSASNSTFSIAPQRYRDLPYDNVEAFAPVAWTALNAPMLSDHPSLPVRTLVELVPRAKAETGRINF